MLNKIKKRIQSCTNSLKWIKRTRIGLAKHAESKRLTNKRKDMKVKKEEILAIFHWSGNKIPAEREWANKRIIPRGGKDERGKNQETRQGKTTGVKRWHNILFRERVLNRNIALKTNGFRPLDVNGDSCWWRRQRAGLQCVLRPWSSCVFSISITVLLVNLWSDVFALQYRTQEKINHGS